MIKVYYGTDNYRIRNKVNFELEGTDSFNQTILNKPNLFELSIALNRYPINSTYRFVVIKSVQGLPNDITTFNTLEKKLETTFLIFQLSGFSKKIKLKNYLEKNTVLFQELNLFKQKAGETYLKKEAHAKSIKFVDRDALSYFLFLQGCTAKAIDDGLDTLKSLEITKPIDEAFITENITRKTEVNTFSLLSNMFKNKNEFNNLHAYLDVDTVKRTKEILYKLKSKLYLGILIKGGYSAKKLGVNKWMYDKTKEDVAAYEVIDLIDWYVEVNKGIYFYTRCNKDARNLLLKIIMEIEGNKNDR